LLQEFQPDVIGIRTLNFYRGFFHRTVSLIRQWGINVPVVAGGPYATSSYQTLLKDSHIDLVVIGEGEITFAELTGHMLDNNNRLPGESILKNIPGLAFVEGRSGRPRTREVVLLDHLEQWEGGTEPVKGRGDLAYVIYTSGSTGTPKGVMIDHANLVNQVLALRREFEFDASMRYLLLASFTFDVSLMHIFLPLTTGARLYLIDEEVRKDSARLWQFIHENGISVLNIVPTFMKALLENIEKQKIGFKYLFVGGDVFPPDLYHSLKETFRVEEVINIYGPTETTINALLYRLPRTWNGKTVPIGKPLPNYEIYILDGDQNPVPVGAAGELYIAGNGVSRGYLNRPELTAQQFFNHEGHEVNKKFLGVQNPSPMLGAPINAASEGDCFDSQHPIDSKFNRFPAPRGKKGFGPRREAVYKTGDLVRWLPDGNVEYIERVDRQVKIRGFRIELGEIESRLRRVEGIKEVLVVDGRAGNGGGDRYLSAYIVPEDWDGFSLEVVVLRKRLAEELPDYMIPAYFVPIRGIPVTPGGKVDRKQLPEPSVAGEYTAPRDELDAKLVELWASVLGKEPGQIGIDTNFFELGGHSLKATILVSRMQKELNFKITLVEFFDAPHIRGLAEYMKQVEPEEISVIPLAEQKSFYPLSPAQKRLYFLQHMDKSNIAYNGPQAVVLEGDLEVEKLEEALRGLIDRHDVFRTVIREEEGRPVQVILDSTDVEFGVQYFEIAGGMEENRDELNGIIRDFVRPFDLGRAPLLRAGIVRTGGSRSLMLLIDMHHIVTDGVSHEIFVRDFRELYAGQELPPLKLQYKDFVEWQNSPAQQEALKKQESYWLEHFRGEVPLLALPTDYARPEVQSFEGRTVGFSVDEIVTAGLKATAAAEGATLFMILLALYDVFLGRVTGQEEVVVSTGVAGRRHPDLQDIMGIFVNTLALRNAPSGAKTFRRFLKEIKDTTLSAFENQEYPFEDIVEKLNVKRDTSRNPLFDTMIVLLNIGREPVESARQTGVKSFAFEGRVSKFDLTLFGREVGGALYFTFEYSSRLFKQETIDGFVVLFKELAKAVVRAPGQTLRQIMQMPEERRQEVTGRLNRQGEEEEKRSLRLVLAESFQRFAGNTALEWCGGSMSFKELDGACNGVASWLVKEGYGPGSLVGILTGDRLEMIKAVIGILKAGCVFVPLDPDLPRQRLDTMIASAGLSLVLTGDHPAFNWADSPDVAGVEMSPDEPVYVYFTSGTTGVPRAMLGSGKGLLHFIEWEIETFNIGEHTRVSQLTAPTFDAFLRDIFTPLCAGGAVCIPPVGDIVKDGEQLVKWLDEAGVQLVHTVPGVFRQMVSSGALTGNGLKRLQYILLSGEALQPADLAGWYETMGERIGLVNLWGTSETTLAKTAYWVRPSDVNRERVPVGLPLPGAEVVVLDENLELCGPWVRGELYIATGFRTLGYLNDPELTQGRFIKNPFNPSEGRGEGDWFHRTGDTGQIRWDGTIDVFGRGDRQVKIRGIRVELEEIENTCIKHPLVREAVVLKHQSAPGNELLCGYLVTESGGESAPDDIEAFLLERLPGYMAPGVLLGLDSFPRKANGKVDYDALPHPLAETELLRKEKQDDGPIDEVELKLLELWADILGLAQDSIGMETGFFRLGGHSLNVMTLISRVYRDFDVRVALGQVFNNPTIRKLAAVIRDMPGIDVSTGDEEEKEIVPIERREYYDTTYAQRRVWVLSQIEAASVAFNMPMALRLSGELSVPALEKAFFTLVERHESLRTVFMLVEDSLKQKVLDFRETGFKLEQADLSGEPPELKEKRSAEIVEAESNRPFDLRQGPLVRARLIRLGEGDFVFLLNMHHIAGDLLSNDVMSREIFILYNTYAKGGGNPLAPLEIQYKDYAAWQNRRLSGKSLDSHKHYWLKQLKGPLPVPDLPVDRPRPESQSYSGAGITIMADEALTRGLRTLAEQRGATLFMVLAAGLKGLLYHYSGLTDIVIGTPVAGRDHVGLENQVGFYLNTLALRTVFKDRDSFAQLLDRVKKGCADAFDHQAYPFDQLVEALGIKRDPGRHPLFDVVMDMANLSSAASPGQETGLGIRPAETGYKSCKFDLTLYISEMKHVLQWTFEYNTGLFEEKTIRRLAERYRRLLEQVVENPELVMTQLELKREKKVEVPVITPRARRRTWSPNS
jgi:amino acid adenylation domain-containing protein